MNPNLYNPVLTLGACLSLTLLAWVSSSLTFGLGWAQTSGWATLAFTLSGGFFAASCGRHPGLSQIDVTSVLRLLSVPSFLAGLSAMVYCLTRGDLQTSLPGGTIFAAFGVLLFTTAVAYTVQLLTFAHSSDESAPQAAYQRAGR